MSQGENEHRPQTGRQQGPRKQQRHAQGNRARTDDVVPADDVCRFFNSRNGCKRVDCRYRHEAPPQGSESNGNGNSNGDEGQNRHGTRNERPPRRNNDADRYDDRPYEEQRRDPLPQQRQQQQQQRQQQQQQQQQQQERQQHQERAPNAPLPVFSQSKRRNDRNGGNAVDEYGNPMSGNTRGHRGAKNTESFTPCHDPPAMRVVVDAHPTRLSTRLTVRDVSLHPCIFSRPGDERLYDQLVLEMERCTIPKKDLLKSWHGDSHWIADDKTGWKKQCPTFLGVIDRLRDYFNMRIEATRFNLYENTSEWKPFHHDAAAVKPDRARTQNFTVGVSFGATRDAAFEEVQSKKVISFPCPNGSVYCFARDTNILWKHGILQVAPERQTNEGRISIIAWGWIELDEV